MVRMYQSHTHTLISESPPPPPTSLGIPPVSSDFAPYPSGLSEGCGGGGSERTWGILHFVWGNTEGCGGGGIPKSLYSPGENTVPTATKLEANHSHCTAVHQKRASQELVGDACVVVSAGAPRITAFVDVRVFAEYHLKPSRCDG